MLSSWLIVTPLFRDKVRGIAVTHLYLLVGCAIPVWCVLVTGISDCVLPHFGWLTIGIGDSFVILLIITAIFRPQ